MKKYIENKEIKSILSEIPQGKVYSDIVDDDGFQYVDLVQEGGGVLGVALIGYTYVLEKAGIRFFSLAGTSAGAINTMLLAGLGKIEEKKSEKILKILTRKNLFDFVDGQPAVKKFINKMLQRKINALLIRWKFINKVLKFVAVVFNLPHLWKTYKILKNKQGINPGNNFEAWMTSNLQNEHVNTLQDLEALRRKDVPRLKNRISNAYLDKVVPKLAIIASDITTHSKIEFPAMAELYWENANQLNPATLVRASMSIPFFFEPLVVKNIPNQGNHADEKWEKWVSYKGEIPSEVKFVDGGMLSNFPINVFHREDNQAPRMPTFGVRLSTYREDYSKTESLVGMCGAMISTMRQIYDYDFLLKHPDYKHLICQIDADGQFNWLDFNMPEKDKIVLFNLGAKKAVDFLKKFDWEAYKGIRQQLAKANV